MIHTSGQHHLGSTATSFGYYIFLSSSQSLRHRASTGLWGRVTGRFLLHTTSLCLVSQHLLDVCDNRRAISSDKPRGGSQVEENYQRSKLRCFGSQGDQYRTRTAAVMRQAAPDREYIPEVIQQVCMNHHLNMLSRSSSRSLCPQPVTTACTTTQHLPNVSSSPFSPLSLAPSDP